MKSFHQYMDEYKRQMELGTIRLAYQGLMEYFQGLRTYFNKKYPDYQVSGNIYLGTMDMTYFSFQPKSLAQRRLKIAIVFRHEAMCFEVWLAGYNKQVQAEYWKLFKDGNWAIYPIVPVIKGADYICKHILVADPDFRDLDQLTRQIELGTLEFIVEIEMFLRDKKVERVVK